MSSKPKKTRAYPHKKNPTILVIDVSPDSIELFRAIYKEKPPYLNLGEPAIPLPQKEKEEEKSTS